MKKTDKKARLIPALFSLLAIILLLFSCAHQPAVEPGADAYTDWGKNPPAPKDMGKHLISGARPFEWWYFDGHLDTGETFVGVFFDPNFSNGKPGVSFSLYKPDWTREGWLAALETGEIRSSTEDIDIVSACGYVHRLGPDSFAAGWRFEDIKVDLTFTTLAPGWLPAAPGVDTEGSDFFWAVHQGRNRFEGTIVKNATERRVTGEGYADHNWGRKPLAEITRSWIWGRVLAGGYTIVYADVKYRDPAIVSKPLYVANGGRMIVGTGSASIQQSDFQMHPVLGRPYPRLIEIDHAYGGVETHLRIRCRALVEELDLLAVSGMGAFGQWVARTFFARPMYCRAIAGFEGEIVEDGVPHPISGECLYEVMSFE